MSTVTLINDVIAVTINTVLLLIPSSQTVIKKVCIFIPHQSCHFLSLSLSENKTRSPRICGPCGRSDSNAQTFSTVSFDFNSKQLFCCHGVL